MSSGTISVRNKNAGFTLMEVIAAMAIAAILAAIAIPSYRSFILRNDRALAKRALTELVGRQEALFLRQRSYAQNFTDLVGTANSTATRVFLNRSGTYTANSTDAAVVYQLDFTVANASAFTLTATAINSQAADTACPALAVTSTGLKTPATGDCWER